MNWSTTLRRAAWLWAAAGLAAQGAPAPPLRWWTTHAMVKVRPYDSAPGSSTGVELFAARNEFESFQLVLRSEASASADVEIEGHGLVGPEHSLIPREHIRVYRQEYLDLRTPSSVEGGTGEWPDPLIPRIDSYEGERRNAFPMPLSRGRNQPLWIEIYTPRSARPGDYSGQLQVRSAGRVQHSIPVRLTVWDFELPSTSTLPNSFGLNGVTALRQHYGRYTNDDDLRHLTRLYSQAALRHRISIHGGSMIPPPFVADGERLTIPWPQYDMEVGPFLDGTVFGDREVLPGARATSVDLRTHGGLVTDALKIRYWRAWVAHFKERGWYDRLFYYVWDEPEPAEFPRVLARAQLAHRADPSLANLVTTSWHRTLAGAVNIWTPLINCLVNRPGFPPYCERTVARSAYDAAGSPPARLWWYQSCGSHGCGGPGGEYFRGWPSYVIDAPAGAHRVMEWMAWKYRIAGELYYSMNQAYASSADPWRDVHGFGGNGDGTLFYPGRPERIGGRSHIPIESLRLKLIREGLEDYEYLSLLVRLGEGDFAARAVGQLVRAPYSWESNPLAFYRVRRELGEKLHAISSATSSARSHRGRSSELPRARSK